MILKLTLPALIVACSATQRSDVQDTLYRIAIAHARGQQNYFYNASTDKSYVNRMDLYEKLVAAKHKVHLGLMSLSRPQIDRYRLKSARAVDVCTNVKIASMELARLMPRKTSETGLHKVLARYFDERDPNSTSAIDWGAMVLAQPRVSVKAQYKKRYQRATMLYVINRQLIRRGHAARPVKFKMVEDTKKDSPKDFTPYQKGGALRPVTDRRLEQ